jgi:glycosyltransferase involved in cell wall biosynthesis
MKHISLNAHLLSLSQSYRGAGISWYINNLLQNLAQVAPDMQFTAFLHDQAFRNQAMRLQFSRWSTHRPIIRILWEQLIQPYALYRTKTDLLHAMAFVAPVIVPCPFVVTVYDLSFLRFPETFRPFNRWYLKQFTTHSVNRARAVIAISESTRQDVINLLGKPAAQVHTIYCGVDDNFRPLPATEVERFKIKRGLPDEFILYLGTLEPRKNIAGLIRAYAAWRSKDPTAPHLVIAGGKGWYYEEIFALVEIFNMADAIHFPGYIPQPELPLWYNAATLFAYPSHFEGFGLPVLEAMACGTPVITSNVSSLPEVVGTAGELVDPTDSDSITNALVRVMTDADMRASMSRMGMIQSANFNWHTTARETADIYRNVISNFL